MENLTYVRCPSCNKPLTLLEYDKTTGRSTNRYQDLLSQGLNPSEALTKLNFKRECCRMRILAPFKVPMHSTVINTPEGALGPLLNAKSNIISGNNVNLPFTIDVVDPLALTEETTSLEPMVGVEIDPKGKEEITALKSGLEDIDLDELSTLIRVEDQVDKTVEQIPTSEVKNVNPIKRGKQNPKSRYDILMKITDYSLSGGNVRNIHFYEQQVAVNKKGQPEIKRSYLAR